MMNLHKSPLGHKPISVLVLLIVRYPDVSRCIQTRPNASRYFPLCTYGGWLDIDLVIM
jgi:hypothetical protein